MKIDSLHVVSEGINMTSNKCDSASISGNSNQTQNVNLNDGLYGQIGQDDAVSFSELFQLEELQKLQDQFANAFGVASIITTPDGTPITQPSNFSRLCQNIIRCTEKGLKNCMHSDAVIGRHNPEGPIVQPCLSGGLWDAGASITAGGQHVANWLIGQVRDKVQKEGTLEKYAREIGADETEFMKAFHEIPSMSQEQFHKIAEMLFTMAGQISQMAYQNLQQGRFINERKRVEAALLESEERFRTTLYSIGDGVITTDAAGKVRLMNPIAEQLTGWTQAEASGKLLENVFRIFNEDTRVQVEVPVRRVLREGVIVGLANHTVLISRDGTEKPIADSGAPIRNESGEIVGVVLVFRDQTEDREAERALRESEERFRNIIQSSPIGNYIYQLQEDGRLIFMGANPSADRIIGIDHRSLLGKTIQQAFPNLASTEVPEMYARIAKGELPTQSFEIDYSENQINGFFQVTVFRIGNNSVAVDFVDISERKQFELKLQRSEQELKRAQQITHIGSWYLNLADNEVFWSDELYKMYGFDPNLPVPPYTEHMKLFTPESWELLSTSIANTAKTGIPYELELKTVREDGGNGWMWVRGETVKDAAGKTVGLWGAAQDISERKQAEQSLFESEEMMRNSQSVAHICSYSTNLNENEIGASFWKCSPEFYNIFGIDKTYPHTIEGWAGFIHPDYREELVAYHEYVIKEKIPFEHEYKIIRINDGAERWVYGTGNLEFDEKGNPIRMHGAIQDITERKKAEEAILDTNKKMDAFFEQSLDGFFFMMLDEPIDWINTQDKEGLLRFSCAHMKISRVNDAMLTQYGAELNQILGKSFLDFFAHDIEQGKDVLKKIFDKGKITLETSEQKINGENMFIEGDYTCLYDSEGRITGLFGIQRDITQSKQAVEAIQNERQLLRTLIDNLPVSIYVKDTQCRKVVSNLTDVEKMGYASERDVVGKTDLELFDGEDGELSYRDDLAVIQTGEPVINREGSFRDPKGTIRWSLTSKLPLFDHHGKVSGLVGISRDITEQKKAHETIQKLSKSVEQSASVVMITDINGNIEYVNPKFTEITGYSLEEIRGRNPRFLKSGEMRPEFYQELWQTISSGGVWRGEFHNRKKNGDLYWEWVTITSIKNERGEITNYIAIKEDTSLRKQMEVDLIVAKEKAEESDRLKSAFLANMSHEIRTPLNSIIGFSELLADADFPEDQKSEFIHHVISNGNNLLNVISDIVDISKIESGEIAIRNSKIQVRQFLDEITSMHTLKVEGKQLRLRSTGSIAEMEVFILADRERLLQVFNNLISNALKFTSEGYIELGCRLVGDMVEFHVKDTGIGIPADYHQKVFDRFRQVEASYTRKYGGTGLGLAISKKLVELMRGEIWVESEVGKGSTFYFTLPKSTV